MGHFTDCVFAWVINEAYLNQAKEKDYPTLAHIPILMLLYQGLTFVLKVPYTFNEVLPLW